MSLAPSDTLGPFTDWVSRTLEDGLEQAKSERATILKVSSRKMEWDIAYRVFDSSVEDAVFFGRNQDVSLGVGVAEAFEADPRQKDVASKTVFPGLTSLSVPGATTLSVMGGWGFPLAKGKREHGAWRRFKTSRWIVPALTLTSHGDEVEVTMAIRIRPDSEARPLLARYLKLSRALAPKKRGASSPESLPRLESARSSLSRAKWEAIAKHALDSISKGELNKVVLARCVNLSFRSKVPASAVLERLVSLNPDSTVFAVKRGGSVFLGATPESLVSVRNGQASVDCLAASLPRGSDRAADESLGARLMGDSKSRNEHQFVVQAAVAALSPISSRVEVPGGPVIKKLTKIQHLYTPLKAELHPGKGAWDAALALWPNPAIGGEPREKAVAWIRKFEKLNRGWYSGVVGRLNVSLDEGDLVVGIRSGVIAGRRASIYAGAGIVAGSEPKEEFEETGWKLRTMGESLGLDDLSALSGV